MKKMLMFAAAGAVAMSCASANDIDVNQIRTACQNSDKTLWVERNQVCIPRNPCKNEKFSQYCNRTFKDVQTRDLGYLVLIDLYAQTHNLSCKPVRQDAKLVGQDFVVCQGTDVMVFEFDDISDFVLLDVSYKQKMGYELCRAAGGVRDGNFCLELSEQKCNLVADVLRNYGFVSYAPWDKEGKPIENYVDWNPDTEHCYLSFFIDNFQAEEETFWKTGKKFF